MGRFSLIGDLAEVYAWAELPGRDGRSVRLQQPAMDHFSAPCVEQPKFKSGALGCLNVENITYWIRE